MQDFLVEELDIPCIINGCQRCKLVRLVCQTLKHMRRAPHQMMHSHCRYCGQEMSPFGPDLQKRKKGTL